MIHEGGCHCGNLRYALTTELLVRELPLRACQCTFCRAHGAVSTSDPAGRLAFTIRDPHRLQRYRFGLKSADFLICTGCGIYVGAEFREGARAWGIVNANTLDEAAALQSYVAPMVYDGEKLEDRQSRRKARWTPLSA